METKAVTKRDQRQSALDYLEKQVDAWNRTAKNKKRVITIWRKRVTITMLLGAALGLASEEVSDMPYLAFTLFGTEFGLDQCLAVLSAISIALSTYAGAKVLSSDLEKAQLKARAACEALKVQGFLYALHARPYSGKNAEKILFKRIEIILKEVSSITPDLNVYKQPTSKIGKLLAVFYSGKADPNETGHWKQKFKEDMTFQEYVDERVNGQIDGYYRKKAAEFQRIISTANAATLIFGFIGVVIGTIGATSDNGLSMWIGLLGTASASIGSYMHANKYEYLLMSYVTTAGQLELLAARYKSMVSPSEAAQRRFVSETETIFAAEHNSWISEIAGTGEDEMEGNEIAESSEDLKSGEEPEEKENSSATIENTTNNQDDESI